MGSVWPLSIITESESQTLETGNWIKKAGKHDTVVPASCGLARGKRRGKEKRERVATAFRRYVSVVLYAHAPVCMSARPLLYSNSVTWLVGDCASANIPISRAPAILQFYYHGIPRPA